MSIRTLKKCWWLAPYSPGATRVPKRGCSPTGSGAGGDDAGQLDLVLDVAVGVEVPEEAVLVVADRGEAGDDQPPGAAHLHLLGPEVGVLPADPEVLLVHADRVRDGQRLTVLVVGDGVEVVDLAQAVAAQLQRVQQQPDAVLALVEHVLDPVGRRGVAVGDVHLRQRGPVHDRAHPAPVLVADLVQDQSLARGVAHPQPPLLPADGVPVHGEARTLGLGDLDRPDVVADRGVRRAVVVVEHQLRHVVAGLLRQRHDAVVPDVDDLHQVQVDQHDQALDRAGVAVVVLPVAHERQRPDQPAALGVLDVEAGRPGVDHRQREVGDAALAHRLLPPGVGPGDLLGLKNSSSITPGCTPSSDRHEDTRPPDRETTVSTVFWRGAVVQHHERRSVQRRPVRVPVQHLPLRAAPAERRRRSASAGRSPRARGGSPRLG